MRAEIPFEAVEEGFDLGRWLGWPQVTVGAAQRRDTMLVNDFQCLSVLGAFVTVTVHQARTVSAQPNCSARTQPVDVEPDFEVQPAGGDRELRRVHQSPAAHQ